MDYMSKICNLFSYDHETGNLIRRTSRGEKYQTGDTVGYIHKSPHTNYKIVKIGIKSYKVHRIIWEICNGQKLEPLDHIDHIDGNGLNNKIENLRKVSHRENHCNKKIHRTGRLYGCSYNPKYDTWDSKIRKGDKKIWLGSFNSEWEAHRMYVLYKENVLGVK